MHYHSCPECYEHYPCDMKCSIEPDLQEGDREFGAYCVCETCTQRASDPVLFSKEWFEIYNGFKKKRK